MKSSAAVRLLVALLLFASAMGFLLGSVRVGRTDPPVKQEIRVADQVVPSYGLGPLPGMSPAAQRALVKYWASIDDMTRESLALHRATAEKLGVKAAAAKELSGDLILRNACGACHGGAEPKGEFRLIADGRLVTLKADEAEAAWQAVEQHRMPPRPRPPLNEAEKEAVRKTLDKITLKE